MGIRECEGKAEKDMILRNRRGKIIFGKEKDQPTYQRTNQPLIDFERDRETSRQADRQIAMQ